MSHSLAVNCGSSSIKIKVFSPDLAVVLSGSASNVQSNTSAATYKLSHGPGLSEKTTKTVEKETSYQEVFEEILLDVRKVLGEQTLIGVVAHRIVHGGKAREAIVIRHGEKGEKETLEKMDQVSDFAPLHNHHAMLIVKKCLDALPNAFSVLCFDTLFHTTIPDFRTTYAIRQPEHETPVPLRRYGFHGLSYASILEQMSAELGKEPSDVNLVVAHLGSGGSVCLIQGGRSTNTSMGLTPLEGLPGGTRSGSLDASLIFHHTKDCSNLVEWSGRSISKAEYVLNKESGFLGLTGTNDFGLITERSNGEKGTKEEQEISSITYQLFLDRILLYISSYISTLFSSSPPLNTLDALVFSGGIGEHSSQLRADVLDSLRWIELLAGTGGGVDGALNGAKEGKAVRRITKQGSKVPGYLVETDEELQCVKIARTAVEGGRKE
ncbi:acetate kinase [Meredithblackwellia eburnea MCA 4105]